MSAQAFEARIRAISSEAEAALVLRDLAAAPGSTEALLSDLATHSDMEVRGFIAANAARLLGGAAATLLLRLADDRNADVRDTAVEELMELDPNAARGLAPKMRRRINRAHHGEKIFLMWRLALLRDEGSLPILDEVAQQAPQSEHRDVAMTAALLIRAGEDEVAKRLLAHDHARTKSLALGLALPGSATGRATLRRAAMDLPDEQCRKWCNSALAVLDRYERIRRYRGA